MMMKKQCYICKERLGGDWVEDERLQDPDYIPECKDCINFKRIKTLSEGE